MLVNPRVSSSSLLAVEIDRAWLAVDLEASMFDDALILAASVMAL
jgi:hypothetical protein